MARKVIDANEWYPVYTLCEPRDYTSPSSIVDIPEEIVARVEAAQKEFDACQQILADLQK